MAKLFADKKSYYADIQDFTQGRKSYFKLLAHYDAKTRFELYRKAGLDEHTITQYEYGVRNVDKKAYEKDLANAYGAETAAKMRSDLDNQANPKHTPDQNEVNWLSPTKEIKTQAPVVLEAKENNFAKLTPSATGEKNTTAAEEEEKVNQRYLTEQERLAQEEQEKLEQQQELQKRKSLTA